MRQTLFIILLLLISNAHSAFKNERSWMENENVFGGQVYVKTVGNPSFPALVLVHGLGDEASTSWNHLIKQLQYDYFIFTLDLPGFGQSSKQNALYSPKNYAKLIHQLTQKIVTRSFHLVGHSMGGAISLQYTHDFPQDVKTLTLVDAAGILHRLAYSKYLAPLGIDQVFNDYGLLSDRRVTSLAGILMGALEQRSPVDLNQMLNFAFFREKVLRGNPSMIAGLALVLNNYSRVPETIRQPTLIIWGDKDRIAPLRTGQVLNALIPNSRLALIKDGSHIAFVERPEAFKKLVVDHLRQKPVSAGPIKTGNTTGYRQRVDCKNENGATISGRIGRLVVENCQELLIEDAEINTVTIFSSSVTLLNTKILSPQTALTVYDSDLLITNGQIEGETAIEAHGSRLDIAGTRILALKRVMHAPVESTTIFSLGRIESPGYNDSVIHGMRIVKPGDDL
jgi:pimeloyl-ACP methyl ester carboxylesterase